MPCATRKQNICWVCTDWKAMSQLQAFGICDSFRIWLIALGFSLLSFVSCHSHTLAHFWAQLSITWALIHKPKTTLNLSEKPLFRAKGNHKETKAIVISKELQNEMRTIKISHDPRQKQPLPQNISKATSESESESECPAAVKVWAASWASISFMRLISNCRACPEIWQLVR